MTPKAEKTAESSPDKTILKNRPMGPAGAQKMRLKARSGGETG